MLQYLVLRLVNNWVWCSFSILHIFRISTISKKNMIFQRHWTPTLSNGALWVSNFESRLMGESNPLSCFQFYSSPWGATHVLAICTHRFRVYAFRCKAIGNWHHHLKWSTRQAPLHKVLVLFRFSRSRMRHSFQRINWKQVLSVAKPREVASQGNWKCKIQIEMVKLESF